MGRWSRALGYVILWGIKCIVPTLKNNYLVFLPHYRYNRDDSDEDEYNRGGGGRRKSRYDDPRQRSLSRGRYDDGGYGSDDSLERR